MAATDVRPKITLACQECKNRNYITRKNRRNDPDRLELKKYCPHERKHTRAPRDPLTWSAADARGREHGAGPGTGRAQLPALRRLRGRPGEDRRVRRRDRRPTTRSTATPRPPAPPGTPTSSRRRPSPSRSRLEAARSCSTTPTSASTTAASCTASSGSPTTARSAPATGWSPRRRSTPPAAWPATTCSPPASTWPPRTASRSAPPLSMLVARGDGVTAPGRRRRRHRAARADLPGHPRRPGALRRRVRRLQPDPLERAGRHRRSACPASSPTACSPWRLAGRAVTDWAGDPGALVEYQVRFGRPVVVPDDDAGAEVTVRGTVGALLDDGRAGSTSPSPAAARRCSPWPARSSGAA